MAQIIKRQNGYSVREFYMYKGKKKSKNQGGFKTKKEAQNYAIELDHKKLNHELMAETEDSFADYFIEWFKNYKEPKLAYATALRYLNTHHEVIKYFGNRRMKDITYDDYQKVINEYAKTHALGTVKKFHSQSHTAVKAAVRRDLLKKDFTIGAELSGLAGKDEELKYLEIEDMHKLLNYCSKNIRLDKVSKVMIVTALYTGMRLAEVGGLTWDCVDFKNHKITINKTYDYLKGGGFKPTKNKSSNRTIDINIELVTILKQLHSIQGEYFLAHGIKNLNNYVFLNNRQNIISSNGAKHELKHLSDLLKIKAVTFHALRHTHASFLIAKGVSIYYISKRLGHSSITVTLDVYSHLLKNFADDESEKALTALSVM